MRIEKYIIIRTNILMVKDPEVGHQQHNHRGDADATGGTLKYTVVAYKGK